MNIDWSKAPAHATHWCPGNSKIESGWIYAPGGGEFYSCYADKGLEHIPDFPAWRALRLIPRPAESPAWIGEGLPPVGTVCEHGPYEDQEHWQKVEVIAHKNVGMPVAVFWDEIRQLVTYSSCEAFRPLRTPEQIAADEHRARYMPQLIQIWDADTSREDFLEAVYEMICEAHTP